jgi:hypothetical protein
VTMNRNDDVKVAADALYQALMGDSRLVAGLADDAIAAFDILDRAIDAMAGES